MDLTQSYLRVAPASVIDRYMQAEVRNAASVLQASNPQQFEEIVHVLETFEVYDDDILTPGGNRSRIPIRLDNAFHSLGWRAVRINSEFGLHGKAKRSPTSQDYSDDFLSSSVRSAGFETDNMKDRVVVDVEWNAKDGNLDRDLSAYRTLYEYGLIDGAVIITRDHEGIRYLAENELGSADAVRRLGTQTTTNLRNLTARLTRGDAGGCPVWAVAISFDTWAGRGVVAP